MKLDGKTNTELHAMQTAIEAKPENRNPSGSSVFIFTPAARRKLDAIRMAITRNLSVARAAAGNPVPCDGYSGRQSNRRR